MSYFISNVHGSFASVNVLRRAMLESTSTCSVFCPNLIAIRRAAGDHDHQATGETSVRTEV